MAPVRYVLAPEVINALEEQGFVPEYTNSVTLEIEANGIVHAVVRVIATPELLVALGAVGQRTAEKVAQREMLELRDRLQIHGLSDLEWERLIHLKTTYPHLWKTDSQPETGPNMAVFTEAKEQGSEGK